MRKYKIEPFDKLNAELKGFSNATGDFDVNKDVSVMQASEDLIKAQLELKEVEKKVSDLTPLVNNINSLQSFYDSTVNSTAVQLWNEDYSKKGQVYYYGPTRDSAVGQIRTARETLSSQLNAAISRRNSLSSDSKAVGSVKYFQKELSDAKEAANKANRSIIENEATLLMAKNAPALALAKVESEKQSLASKDANKKLFMYGGIGLGILVLGVIAIKTLNK